MGATGVGMAHTSLTKKNCAQGLTYGFIHQIHAPEAAFLLPHPAPLWHIGAVKAMERKRMQVLYSGTVQGVGFRYAVKSVAPGFEVNGTVRNLPDGRVELQAEGPREELEAFRQAVRDSGLEHFIRDEQVRWSEASGEFRGFEIVR